jgi:hypothetical protein
MVAVRTILSILKSNLKINLDAMTYFPYIPFTEGALLPSPQHDAQHRTALS